MAKQLLSIIKTSKIPRIPFLFSFFIFFTLYFPSLSTLSLLPTAYPSSLSPTFSASHSSFCSRLSSTAARRARPRVAQRTGDAAARRSRSSPHMCVACARPCEGTPLVLVAARPRRRPYPWVRRLRPSPRGHAVVPSYAGHACPDRARAPPQGQRRPWLSVGVTSARRSRWELVFSAPLVYLSTI